MKLLDDGYTTIHCSTCNAPLCEVYLYHVPNKETPTYFVVAECAHCNDRSYKVQADGQIAFGSTEYTRALPEYNDDATCAIIKTEVLKEWK